MRSERGGGVSARNHQSRSIFHSRLRSPAIPSFYVILPHPMNSLAPLFLLALSISLASTAHADVVVLSPVADCFLCSSNPAFNYGGGGALSLASPSSPNGEFQTLLRFDASPAIATLNASLGTGLWSLQSVTLRLTAAPPVSPLFNPTSAGDFGASWLANDSWIEGTGTPAGTVTTGVTFNDLPALLSPNDEPLGTFHFDGSTTAAATSPLALTPSFRADLTSGALVSIRLFVPPTLPSQSAAYVFYSRTFTAAANHPLLTLTAIPICPPDFNHSGTLTVQDIFDFLSAWFGGSPAADFNHVNGLTVQDIFDFLGAWFIGC